MISVYTLISQHVTYLNFCGQENLIKTKTQLRSPIRARTPIKSTKVLYKDVTGEIGNPTKAQTLIAIFSIITQVYNGKLVSEIEGDRSRKSRNRAS